jgi:septal ring factor EnvC (AmiA/AmiB activator)
MCRKNGFTLLLLFLLFGLSLPCLSYSEGVETLPISRPSATRILAISQRLQTIAIEQESERIASLKQIDDLLKEIGSLKGELSALKNQSTTLSQDSENTAIDSSNQEKEIKRLEALAESLKASFETYRDLAEKKIARLERQARFWSFIGKLALCVSAGEGIYIVASNLF